jgi:hypothetical protein
VTGTGLLYSNAGTLNSAAVTLSGDVSPAALSGNDVPITVVAAQNQPISATPPSSAGVVWTWTGSEWAGIPSGGSAIDSFSVGTTNAELGQSLASVTFNATANNTPTSATLSWSGVASGSQSVTPGTTMSGTVTGPFTSSTNNSAITWTLTCVFPDGTKTRSTSTTWAAAIFWAPSAAPTTVTIATLRATNISIQTNNVGDFSATMASGQYFTWSNPAAYNQPPTVMFGVLAITPVLQQSSVAYTNPYGVSVPMDVYTFGVSGIGAATFDVTS